MSGRIPSIVKKRQGGIKSQSVILRQRANEGVLMKLNLMLISGAALWAASAGHVSAQQVGSPAPSPITVSVDLTQTSPAVSPYEYGMFIEPIRTLMSASLWAEMIDDRKFYFPITSQPTVDQGNVGGGPPRGAALRRWVPV